jgi:hypothetical protein
MSDDRLRELEERLAASSEALVLMTELFVQASIERLRLLKKLAARSPGPGDSDGPGPDAAATGQGDAAR